jgi:hypothetical protein
MNELYTIAEQAAAREFIFMQGSSLKDIVYVGVTDVSVEIHFSDGSALRLEPSQFKLDRKTLKDFRDDA